MNWNDVFGILTPIGTILGIIGGFFCVLTYIKSLRKPKARLRFANGKREITFFPHYYQELSIKYYVVPYPALSQFDEYHSLVKKYKDQHKGENEFILSFRLSNIGKFQLEDYRVDFEIEDGKTCKPLIT